MNTFGKLLVATALTAAAAATAQAQVNIHGFATGCFGPGCTLGNFDNSVASLVWRGAEFTGTTVGGSVSFGGNAAPTSGPFNLNNFGSFDLSNDDFNYAGTQFKLRLEFDGPASGFVDYVGTLSGAVSGGTGGVHFEFAPVSPVAVPGGAAYNLKVSVNDLDIFAHQNAPLSGNVQASIASVPEPASVALMATGLVALVGVARRRRV